MARDPENHKANQIAPRSIFYKKISSVFSFLGGYKSVLCPSCLVEIRYRDNIESCPSCKFKLPASYINDYKDILPFFMQLIGWSQAGKTAYLQSLIFMLENMSHYWKNYYDRPLTDDSLRFQHEARNQTKGFMPNSTAVTPYNPYIFQLHGMERWGNRTLITRDIAGELFNDFIFPLQYMPYLIYEPTALMVLSIPDLEEKVFSIDQLMNSYVNTLAHYDKNYRGISRKIVIVLTKADLITQLPEDIKNYLHSDPFSAQIGANNFVDSKFMSGYMKNLYRNNFRIKKWFSQLQGGQTLINIAEKENFQLFFTLVSSTGVFVSESNPKIVLNPTRVLDPFFLTLDLSSEGSDIEFDEA